MRSALTTALRPSLGQAVRPPPHNTRGPELVSSIASFVPSGTGVTVDGTGIQFTAANNTTSYADYTLLPASEPADDATFEVTFEVQGRTGGSVRVLVYGLSANRLGTAGPVSANGVHTVRVRTDGAGSLTRRIRVQATGTSGQNTFKVVRVSVRRIS